MPLLAAQLKTNNIEEAKKPMLWMAFTSDVKKTCGIISLTMIQTHNSTVR
jgi:hypothetical protein